MHDIGVYKGFLKKILFTFSLFWSDERLKLSNFEASAFAYNFCVLSSLVFAKSL